MNRIYKVIWNKAKQCYMVVSELAKSRSKSPSVGRTVRGSLAAVIVAAVISGGMMFNMSSAFAADQSKYVAFGVGGNYTEGNQNDGSLVIDNHKYTKQTVSIGGENVSFWVRDGYQISDAKQEWRHNYDASTTRLNNGYVLNVTRVSEKPDDGGLLMKDSSVAVDTRITTLSGNTLQNLNDSTIGGVVNTYSVSVGIGDEFVITPSGDKLSSNKATASHGIDARSMRTSWNTIKNKVTTNEDGTYTYNGSTFTDDNIYNISGEKSVFIYNNKVYTGKVYGRNNELLSTKKDGDNYVSGWMSEINNPNGYVTNQRLENRVNTLLTNDAKVAGDAISKIEANPAANKNSGSINFTRRGTLTGFDENGNPQYTEQSAGKITITSEAGSNGTNRQIKFTTGEKDTESSFKIDAGSDVKANPTNVSSDNKELNYLTVNGETFKLSKEAIYTAGDGISINDANSISVNAGNGLHFTTENGISKLTNNLSITAADKNAENGEKGAWSIVDNNGTTTSTYTNTVLSGAVAETEITNGKTDKDKVVYGKDYTIKDTAGNTATLSDVASANTLKNVDTKVNEIKGSLDDYSKTDYRLIKSDSGKYTVGTNGKITLQVKDVNDPNAKAEDIEIDGIAVVYDGKGNLISTNADPHVGDKGKNSIILGNGAGIQKTGINALFGNADNSTVIGDGAWAYNGSSTALGAKAHSGKNGIAIGYSANPDDSYARQGGITIGANAKSHGLYSTIIGTDASIEGNSKKIGSTAVQGAASTVIGAKNLVDNKAGDLYSGIANSIAGAANTVTNSNGVTIQGTGNTVTNAYKDMNISYSEASKIANGDYSILSKKDSGAVAVIGGANSISDTTSSTFIGFGNKVTGNAEKGSSDVFVAGSHNTLTNTSNTVSLGNNITLENRNNVVTFGNNNKITADNAVAVGNDGQVLVEGGVALGDGSIASTAAGAVGYLAPELKDGEKYTSTWKSTTGAVSVGGNGVTRQITNVAAGSQDTDAVNVAQLKQAQTALEESSYKGWKLTTNKDEKTKTDVASDGTVDFSGDKNITVSNDGTNVSVKLNNHVTLDEKPGAKVDLNGDDGTISSEVTTTNEADGTEQTASTVIKGDTITIKDGRDGTDDEGHTYFDRTEINGGSITSTIGSDLIGPRHIFEVNENGVTFTAENRDWLGNSSSTTTTINGKQITAGDIKVNGEAGSTVTGLSNITWNGTTDNTSRVATEGQLEELSKGLTNKGLTFAGNSGSITKKLGDTVTIKGEGSKDDSAYSGENVKTVVDENGNLVVKLDKNMVVDSISAGNNKFDNLGLTIGNSGSSQIIIQQSNISMGGNQIHNVAAGTAGTDAVNKSQLDQAIESAKGEDQKLVQNKAEGSNGAYKPNENGDVNLRVEDSKGNGYDVTIKDVASKAQQDKNTTVIGDKDNDGTVRDEYTDAGTTYIKDSNNLVDADIALDKAITDLSGKVDQAQANHTEVTAGNGITVTDKGTKDKHNYEVGLADDFTLGGKENQNGAVEIKGSEGDINATGTIKSGDVVINGKDANGNYTGTVSNLHNTTWDADTAKAVSENKNGEKAVAATQGQLGAVDEKVNTNTENINKNTQQITNNTYNIQNLQGQVGDLNKRMNDVEQRIDKVGAMAAAMANLHTMGYDPEAPTEIAAGIGQYKGETALAVGFFHYPNQDFMLSGSVSVAGDEVMAGVGATWKIGRKTQAQLDAKEAEKRIEKAAELKRAAKDAEVKAQAQRHAQLLAEREAAQAHGDAADAAENA